MTPRDRPAALSDSALLPDRNHRAARAIVNSWDTSQFSIGVMR